MEEQAFFAAAVALSVLVIPVMFGDGFGLVRGIGALHRLGIPFRHGTVAFSAPLPPDSELPRDVRGPNGVWLDEQTVGYWSARVRFGFRDSIGISAARGVGICCSGILRLSEDRRTATYTERLRLAPMVLLVGVSVLAAMMWSEIDMPLPVLSVPFVFFGLFYAFFARLSTGHLRDVRAHLEA